MLPPNQQHIDRGKSPNFKSLNLRFEYSLHPPIQLAMNTFCRFWSMHTPACDRQCEEQGNLSFDHLLELWMSQQPHQSSSTANAWLTNSVGRLNGIYRFKKI
jgi:hypothetical protein